MVSQKGILIGVFVLVCVGILIISSSGKMKLGSGNVGNRDNGDNGEDCQLIPRENPDDVFLRCKTRKPLTHKNININDTRTGEKIQTKFFWIGETKHVTEGDVALRSKYLTPDDISITASHSNLSLDFSMKYDKDNNYHLINSNDLYYWKGKSYYSLKNWDIQKYKLRIHNEKKEIREIVLDDLEIIYLPKINYIDTEIQNVIFTPWAKTQLFHLDDTNSVKA